MPKRKASYFFIFLFLSISIFLLSKFNYLETPKSYLSQAAVKAVSPLFSLGDFAANLFQNDTKKLRDENLSLQKKLLDQQKLIDENKALHDQFQTASPRSLDLLAANVVGKAQFLPGIFLPESFVIDKGSEDNVKVGSAVVFKDNLVGRIEKTSKFLSFVALVGNPTLRFTAKTQKGAIGVIKGEGNADLFLDNVLLSEKLQKGELVLTSGDLKIDQTGLPADLIVGQIVSVESNASDLFQRAKLKTLVDFSKVSKVFIVKGEK